MKIPKLSHFSAIIFDMDGLVLETETTYLHAWQQAAQKMNYQFDDAFCLSLLGLDSNAVRKCLFKYCGSTFDLDYFYQLSRTYWYAHVKHYGIKQKKGLTALLAVLATYKIPYCLATNSFEINARECLALAGLTATFKLMITRDQVKQGKPAPDIFLKAANLLQHPIDHCLVLEDSLIGMTAAQRAGAYPLLIPSQPIIADGLSLSTDAIFKDLAEVAKFIALNRSKN